MPNIYRIDPRTQRHKSSIRHMFNDACTVAENLNGRIAGYAIVAWDDRGERAYACQGGGIVSLIGAPEFVKDTLNSGILKG